MFTQKYCLVFQLNVISGTSGTIYLQPFLKHMHYLCKFKLMYYQYEPRRENTEMEH